jgi:hypothetical protein
MLDGMKSVTLYLHSNFPSSQVQPALLIRPRLHVKTTAGKGSFLPTRRSVFRKRSIVQECKMSIRPNIEDSKRRGHTGCKRRAGGYRGGSGLGSPCDCSKYPPSSRRRWESVTRRKHLAVDDRFQG